jgi:UDP-N-acetylglucosamine 2-epimerase (non-hydrolysing)
MSGLKILNVIGCRPNLIKIAPVLAEMKKSSEINPFLVYTGQHHEEVPPDFFFRDLQIPRPDVCLNVGSGSYARQVALVMQALEGVLLDINPDLVLVLGDTNSTVASCVTAISLGFPVAHVEAGLRNFRRDTPEEINRVMTDSISDFLFATERSAVKNLLFEGRPRNQIFMVGNVMIDTLMLNADRIARSTVLSQNSLGPRSYGVVAMRSAPKDEATTRRVLKAILTLQRNLKLVVPIQAQTSARLDGSGWWPELLSMPNIQTVEPLGYIDFMKLLKESLFVMTDKGAVQEESTALGIPCLTLCESTERIATVTQGTNQLVGTDENKIVTKALEICNGVVFRGGMPDKWDGMTSQRIVSDLMKNQDRIKGLYSSVKQRGICLDMLSHT